MLLLRGYTTQPSLNDAKLRGMAAEMARLAGGWEYRPMLTYAARKAAGPYRD